MDNVENHWIDAKHRELDKEAWETLEIERTLATA